jgi:hypothetical protein
LLTERGCLCIGAARIALACLALGCSAGASAQGYLGRLLDDFEEVKALSQRKQRFEFENDVLFKTDRNYTDGARYSFKYVISICTGLPACTAMRWLTTRCSRAACSTAPARSSARRVHG